MSWEIVGRGGGEMYRRKGGEAAGWGGNGGVNNQGMHADLHAESLCGHVWADGQKRGGAGFGTRGGGGVGRCMEGRTMRRGVIVRAQGAEEQKFWGGLTRS